MRRISRTNSGMQWKHFSEKVLGLFYHDCMFKFNTCLQSSINDISPTLLDFFHYNLISLISFSKFYRFGAEVRSVVSHLFHQWAKKSAFQEPKRLLDKVHRMCLSHLKVTNLLVPSISQHCWEAVISALLRSSQADHSSPKLFLFPFLEFL